METLLFDNTYTGPRWTYGLTLRPIDSVHLPEGWIIKSDRKHSNFPTYGTIDFARELTPRETRRYALVLAGQTAGTKQA